MLDTGSKILTVYASIAKQYKLLPMNPFDVDILMESHMIQNNSHPVYFAAEKKNGKPQIKSQIDTRNIEGMIEEDQDKESYDEEEEKAIEERDMKVNANLDSFKNLLTMKSMGSVLNYMVYRKKALLDARVFFNNLDNHLLQHLFNMAEIKPLKKLRFFTLESCKNVLKFYIPTNIFYDQLKLRKKLPVIFKNRDQDIYGFKLEEIVTDSLFYENPVYIMIRMLLDKKLKNFEKRIMKHLEEYQKRIKEMKKRGGIQFAETRKPENGFKDHQETIDEKGSKFDGENEMMEVDGNDENPIYKKSKKPNVRFNVNVEGSRSDLKGMVKDWLLDTEKKYFENIIIHCHGGGFVGMSSSSHQVYLRKWAQKLGIPIFSIDYRLAPQTKFPFPLNDCIRSYVWILTFLEGVLGCQVKKVTLVGDSAGGNLILGITNWCIENRFRKPDVVQAVYPASSLNRAEFTPSFLYSMEDYLLHFNVLRGVSNMYVPPHISLIDNYYVSPLYTPDDICKEYPKINLFVCEYDPLRDGSLRLGYKLMYC